MANITIRAPKGANKDRKILGRGRGSGKGKTCGKGHKGQNSRSGGGVRPGFEGGQMPLYRRVARKGFSNYHFKKIYQPINLDELESRFTDGDLVNLQSLKEKNLIKNKTTLVKILGQGNISKKLTVEGLKISSSAAEKIEKAGGSIKTGTTKEKQVEHNGQ